VATRGIARERQVRDLLLADDWWVARAAGSLGDADLVACKQGTIRLVEVKATHRGPYHSFGPKDRADLTFAAKLAGAEAWLCWWPPRDKPHWIPSSAWPRSLRATDPSLSDIPLHIRIAEDVREAQPVEAHRFECVIDESAGQADE
jgi:Holliday junction resolvase